jgi:hypothetical protein
MRLEIRGVERLSFRERQVVALKESGSGNESVARRLGLSVATVATLYARAKAKGYQVVLVLDGDPLGLHDPSAEGDEPLGDVRSEGKRDDEA